MAVLEADKKQNYYPTGPATTAAIAASLRPEKGLIRVYDPCAGEATALDELRQALARPHATVEAYGIEINAERAKKAAARLGESRLLPVAFEATRVSHDAFGLLLLNPPYTRETLANENKQHMPVELTFLHRACEHLQEQGILIYIVKKQILDTYKLPHFLAIRFDRIEIYAAPPESESQKDQVILFGIKRAKLRQDAEAEQRIAAAAVERLPYLHTAPITPYVVPAAARAKITFLENQPTDSRVMEILMRAGAHTSNRYQEFIDPPQERRFQTILPPNAGHTASILASGGMGVVALKDLLLRGASVKVKKYFDENDQPVSPDSPDWVDVREAFSTEIYVLYPDGRRQTLDESKSKEMEALLKGHAEELGRIIRHRYKPIYEGPTRQEWRTVSQALPNRKLPFTDKPGLLPTQKHIVIALNRALQTQKVVNLVADPGAGKTPMASALAYLHNQWPAVAMVPGHTVQHWKDDFEATVPDGQAFIATDVGDVIRFVENYRHGERKLLIAAMTTHKLGPGTFPLNVEREQARARHANKKKPKPVQRTFNIERAIIFNRLPPAHRGPHPEPAHRHSARFARQPGTASPGIAPKSIGISYRATADEKKPAADIRRTTVCPRCGAPTGPLNPEQPKRCEGRIYKGLDASGARHYEPCGEALFSYGVFRKWSVARYISQHLKGFFGLFIADELHEYKSQSSENGNAFYLLVEAARHTVTLTGTLGSGYAKDLFPILYRTVPAVRSRFSFLGLTEFVELYGRRQYTYASKPRNDDDGDVGYFSGKNRYLIDVQEKPGYSPYIFELLLPNTIFMRLSDLGYDMVEYKEQIVPIPLGDKLQPIYNWLDKTLMEEVKKYIRSNDKDERRYARSILARWLTETLYYGTNAYRIWPILYSDGRKKDLPFGTTPPAKQGITKAQDDATLAAGRRARYATKHPLDRRDDGVAAWEQQYAMWLLPAVEIDELLPKEKWLVDKVLQERRENRRTMVYVAQTASRDIRPRIEKVLLQHGIRAVIVPDLAPAEREQWIRTNAPNADAIIVNPNSVKTGMNLIMFPTIVMFEPQTSLFTILQAMHRSLRPTQTVEVRAFYPVYQGTTEENIMALVQAKAGAAAILAGDTTVSALAELDDIDLLAEIARRAIDGTTLATTTLDRVLADMVHVRNINLPDYEEEGDPVSLTIEAPSEPPPPKPAPTPSESTLATWLRLQALHAATAKPKKAPRRSPPPPAQAAPIQIELF